MNICKKSKTFFSSPAIIEVVGDPPGSPLLDQWLGLPASTSIGCNHLTLLPGTALGLEELQCAGNCLATSSPRKKNLLHTFAGSCGVNTCTKVDFKLPT